MYAWLIVIFVSGLLALFPFQMQQAVEPLPGNSVAGGSWESLDFVAFRNLAIKAVSSDQTIPNGVVTSADVGMTPRSGAVAQMLGGILYVYAPLDSTHLARIRELLHGSQAIGTNNGGVFDNGAGAGIALPAFVPVGAIVSVTQVR